MTRTAGLLFGLAALLAVTDWVGCARGDRRLRWVGKPGALLLLLAAAFTLHPQHEFQRDAFVGALVLSLFGDIYLLLADQWFSAGLGAFLVAHLAYIAGFVSTGPEPIRLVFAAIAVAVPAFFVGRRVLSRVASSKTPAPLPAVAAYLVVISAMVALAIASGKPVAALGAMLFFLSDGLIAWNRYVRPLPQARLPIIVAYHLAQGLLVFSLV